MLQAKTVSRTDLAAGMARVATLEGEFLLRSGQVSNRYFDKYRFEGDPVLLASLAREMAELLPANTDIIAGLELGGVPLVSALSLHTGLPAAFIRKEAKTYGTCRAVEGQDIAGRNITFIEDVITTGGAVADAHKLVTAEDATVLAVICAIWRGDGAPNIQRVPDLTVLPVFTPEDLA